MKFSRTPLKSNQRLQKPPLTLKPLSPHSTSSRKHTPRNHQISFSKFPPEQINQNEQLQRKNSVNILRYLDQKDKIYKHKYKQFHNHSKVSDLPEIKNIIEELLDKHAVEKELSSSEQYILIGYISKFIEFAEKSKRLMNNPFNINQRLATQNSQECIGVISPSSSPKKSPKGRDLSAFNKRKNKNDEKRDLLMKQFQKIKFLWQIFQLKNLVCPNLSRCSEQQESQNRRELLDMVSKLKGLERTKNKIGEEKALMEVSKIIRRFEMRIKSILI